MLRHCEFGPASRGRRALNETTFCDTNRINRLARRFFLAQRSNPESLRGDGLDCFAALAMTESAGRVCRISGSARVKAPSLLQVIPVRFRHDLPAVGQLH